MRVATWNVNSVHTAEAELYKVADEEDLDVLFLQETRTSNFKLRGRKVMVNSMKAMPKKHKKGGYLSGGLATIALKENMITKDAINSSDCLLVSNLITESRKKDIIKSKRERIKLINVYMQPDRK